MKIKKYFNKFTILAIFLFQLNVFGQTMNLPAPREEKLLNGLKLLVWADAKAEKASVRIRIHSGSAFDPQAKEGVMILLTNILFPNQASWDYFEEDLGGNLEVESSYDYIQINATGDNDKILELLEAMATAVTRPQIDKDTAAKVKTDQLEAVKSFEQSPWYLAIHALSRQLYGKYPYGRPHNGTSESLSKIDYVDILQAKQKFLTADNATVAVSGNFKFDLIFRAARRYFGGWQKADTKIPSTFTQPDAPNVKPFVLNNPAIEKTKSWIAMNGFARNDRDFFASQILAKIFVNKSKTDPPDFSISNGYLLGGIFIIGGSFVSDSNPGETKPQITLEEFEKAKAEVLADLNKKNLADLWFDVTTYKLVSVKDELQKANDVRFEDVQRVSDKIYSQPKVTVILTKTAETTSTSK